MIQAINNNTWHNLPMVGPNKQFDQTEVLSKALQVFWDNGYEATSMQDLVSAMGINRASMYQTYGNKYALFNASIDLYINNSVQHFEQALSLPGSPLANLQQLFLQLIEYSLKGHLHGCLINNTAIEFGPHDPDMASKLRQAWQRFEDLFIAVIEHAVTRGECKPDTDARLLGLVINVQLQGLIAKTKVDTPKETLYNSVECLFKLIRQ